MEQRLLVETAIPSSDCRIPDTVEHLVKLKGWEITIQYIILCWGITPLVSNYACIVWITVSHRGRWRAVWHLPLLFFKRILLPTLFVWRDRDNVRAALSVDGDKIHHYYNYVSRPLLSAGFLSVIWGAERFCTPVQHRRVWLLFFLLLPCLSRWEFCFVLLFALCVFYYANRF